MRTLVVLGTGTEIGKTYVSRVVMQLLKTRVGGPVLGLKPVESGVSTLDQSDAGVLAALSRPPLEPRHAVALSAAVSPHLAARLEGKRFSVHTALEWTQAVVRPYGQSNAGWLLIETAGGVFTPLNARETNATLATAFEPAIWLLVAPDRLGVLHELTATVKALEQVARKPDFVLLNAPEVPDASTGTNRAEIERLGIAQVVGVVGRNEGLTDPDQAHLFKCLGV